MKSRIVSAGLAFFVFFSSSVYANQLHVALSKPSSKVRADEIRFLIERLKSQGSFDIDERDPNTGMNALRMAVFMDRDDLVRILLNHGANPVSPSHAGNPLLRAAFARGCYHALLELIKCREIDPFDFVDEASGLRVVHLLIASGQYSELYWLSDRVGYQAAALSVLTHDGVSLSEIIAFVLAFNHGAIIISNASATFQALQEFISAIHASSQDLCQCLVYLLSSISQNINAPLPVNGQEDVVNDDNLEQVNSTSSSHIDDNAIAEQELFGFLGCYFAGSI